MSESKYVPATEIAKYVRADLTRAFSGVTFRVQTKHHTRIEVRWVDGPTAKEVEAVVGKYAGSTFDGMQDLREYHSIVISGEEVRSGADSVFCEREYSVEFLTPVVQRLCERWDVAAPDIQPPSQYDGARIASDPFVIRADDYLSHLLWRELESLSARALKAQLKEHKSQAANFRKLADAMQATIDDKLRDGDEHTARMANQVASRKSDGRKLQVLQDKLRALAVAWDDGSIRDSLKAVSTKKQIEILISNRWPGGPYQEDERKTLAQCGITNDILYREAAFQLEGLGNPEAGGKTRADQIHEAEVAVCRMKIAGFFPTSEDTVNQMLQAADIQPHMRVLEPSAGKGDIADGIRDWEPTARLKVVEINGDLRHILELKGLDLVADDFLTYDSQGVQFERILMNPPFENLADVDHVRRAFDLLADGGRLVALMSPGAFFREDKKAKAFRAWFENIHGEMTDLGQPMKDHKEKRTGVNVRLVVIDKPVRSVLEPAVMQPDALELVDADNPADTYVPVGAVLSDTVDWCAFSPTLDGRVPQCAIRYSDNSAHVDGMSGYTQHPKHATCSVCGETKFAFFMYTEMKKLICQECHNAQITGKPRPVKEPPAEAPMFQQPQGEITTLWVSDGYLRVVISQTLGLVQRTDYQNGVRRISGVRYVSIDKQAPYADDQTCWAIILDPRYESKPHVVQQAARLFTETFIRNLKPEPVQIALFE